MCGLCGVLGGLGHWSDSAAAPEVFAARAEPHTRRRERQARTRLLNKVLAHHDLTISDWGGNAYVLRGPTGRTAIVNNLTELWDAVDRFARRPCDPLDPGLLDHLRRAG